MEKLEYLPLYIATHKLSNNHWNVEAYFAGSLLESDADLYYQIKIIEQYFASNLIPVRRNANKNISEADVPFALSSMVKHYVSKNSREPAAGEDCILYEWVRNAIAHLENVKKRIDIFEGNVKSLPKAKLRSFGYNEADYNNLSEQVESRLVEVTNRAVEALDVAYIEKVLADLAALEDDGKDIKKAITKVIDIFSQQV